MTIFEQMVAAYAKKHGTATHNVEHGNEGVGR